VDHRPVERHITTGREQGWIPEATIVRLREVVSKHLDGSRALDKEVESVAASLAAAAHAAGHAPERLLIAIRELWRDFTLSQHDRLQLASLYDRLVRRTIDRYYEE
jgi:hypothetical protein